MKAPGPLGRRGALALGLLALGLFGAALLGLNPAELVPREGGLRIARDFLAAAPRPALDYQGAGTAGYDPFLGRVAGALVRTLVFAAAGLSLALAIGLPLGFLASSSWWAADPYAASPGRGWGRGWGRRALALQSFARLGIAAMRSVHELLFAVLFLAAFGSNTAAAVLAIAIPFGGTLAKVFADMLDEVPSGPGGSAFALRAAGVAPVGTFLFGTLPRALPDMAAYTFYRLECAVRSSAVLGFFGYETLGYYLRLSFENLHYREVWTYLYALLALVLVLEGWSALLRRRFVA